MSYTSISLTIIAIYIVLYISVFTFLKKRLQKKEKVIIELFLQKLAKIPALIEVMRDFVHDSSAFAPITELHWESMIREYDGIYLLLEHNARIQREFLFLMKLSAHIPEIQKNEYFLYIRDFIIRYEHDMESLLFEYNEALKHWNRCIEIKNATIIGYLFPGRKETLVIAPWATMRSQHQKKRKGSV